jgi:hypothetical protein
MKRFFIILAILAIAIAGAVGVSWWYENSKSGRGGGATAEQELPPFDRVAVEGFTDVTLLQGAAERIALQGSSDYVGTLRLDVTDGRLTIANPRARRWWLDFMGDVKPARITLTYRKLNALTVEGAGTVRIDRLVTDRLSVSAAGAASVRIAELEANDLTVTGSGALKMEIAGRTVSQKIRISGAGDYQAAKLDSQTAAVTVSGAGRVVVRAQKTLDVGVSGAGSVEYFGDPKVTQDIRGVGSVRRRGGAE